MMRQTSRFATILSVSAVAAATLLAGHSASAQTLPPANWTGFHVGAYAGGAFGDTGMSLISGSGELNLAKSPSTSTSIAQNGFVGGGLIGYDLQLPSSLVLGGEFDFGGNTANGSGITVTAPGFPATNKLSEPWNLHGRLRAGWAYGQFLPFVAAGVSVTKANLNLVFPCGPVTYTDSTSKTLVGFNVGAGVDYTLSQHVTARLEYVFDDYGTPQLTTAKPDWNDRKFSSFNSNVVRIAAAYHF